MLIKPSTIRIWIHDKDLGRLQKIMWEGLGDKLKTETSTNPLIRRFLNAVPYIMGTIREIHSAAVNNDLELLIARSQDPVPKDILMSKDVNGLTPLHKAAGLGHMDIAREILRKAPEAANVKDFLDRTPLHYAAALKDQGEMFQFLVDSGGIDHLEDKKANTPSYYHGKPAELDGPKLLTVVPDAPRTAHIFPPSWDWKLLGGKDPEPDTTPVESPQDTSQAEDAPEVSEESVQNKEELPDPVDPVEPMQPVEREVEEEQPTSSASQEEQQEDISPRPDISEDEGVGSEVPASGEEVPSPQSDTANEEYEDLQAARLGDSVALSVRPLASIVNVEIVNDSGNEDEREENEEEGIINDEARQEIVTEEEGIINDEERQLIVNEEGIENINENLEQTTIDTEETGENLEVTEISNEEVEQSLDDIRLSNTIQTSYGPDRLQTGEKISDKEANNEGTPSEENGLSEGRVSTAKFEQTNENKTENTGDIKTITNIPRSAGETLGTPADSNEETFNTNQDNAAELIETLEDGNEINIESDEKNETISSELGEDNSRELTSAKSDKDENNETEDSDNKKLNDETREGTSPISRLSSTSGELVPLRTISRRAEVLAITPADPDEMDDPELQEAVAGRTPESSRQRAYELVKSGDMEAMAELVLSGQGSSLLGLSSDNPDVQLFINNVPHYIAKIDRVHKAAREGDLRGVQTALDRRKFAVARDNSTPLKPTPLHVAALFGRTNVLRYLAGRFPETMHAQDTMGRTPLHYAATLPDNGHFYSLLVTLGADKAFPDNNGRTAEDYLRNKGEQTRESLLAEYQNRDVPVDMSGLNFNRYSDKGAELLREGYPIFNPEDGQYLAASLGEPLIKGLTEVAQIRPRNPVIHLAQYLLAYDQQEDGGDKRKSIGSAEGERQGTGGTENTSGDIDINDNKQEAVGSVKEDSVDEDEEKEKSDIEDDDSGSDTVDEPAFKAVNRDEHGQSMLHFAAARAHGRNAMFQLLQEMDANVGLRDGLYRTARDIAQQLDIQDNITSIDKYIVSLAAKGQDDKLKELMNEGYDHILDAVDDDKNIFDIVSERDNETTLKLLQGISVFEERREKLHRAIRFGSWQDALETFRESDSPRQLALAKNQQGRCSLHVAVLNQNEAIVEHIAKRYPATLRVGDNLMRTPLHYAMGVEKVEPLSRILIAAGAQRVLKDLKGRQPSYYFMNKTDIQKLQDEEEALRV